MPPLCKSSPDDRGLVCQRARAKLLLRTCRLTHARQSYTWLDWLCVVLPMMRWVRTYKLKEYLLVRLRWHLSRVPAASSSLFLVQELRGLGALGGVGAVGGGGGKAVWPTSGGHSWSAKGHKLPVIHKDADVSCVPYMRNAECLLACAAPIPAARLLSCQPPAQCPLSRGC